MIYLCHIIVKAYIIFSKFHSITLYFPLDPPPPRMHSPKYHQLAQEKPLKTKAQIRNLTHELERSRAAVENICHSKFQIGQGKMKEKIDLLQAQLQVCATSIHVQAKKHRILGELIGILKGEMFKYQKTKKKEEEAEEVKMDKQIAKCQYQIDQILQKHNEQIAKINNLKDLANSRRSERVVYSSLFKKLQKQIKYYQQNYKQQLILSQYMKSQKHPSQLKSQSSTFKQPSQHPGAEQKKDTIGVVNCNSTCIPSNGYNNNRQNTDNKDNKYSTLKQNRSQQTWNGFITENANTNANTNTNNINRQHISPYKSLQIPKKFHVQEPEKDPKQKQKQRQQKNQFKASFYKEDKLNYTKQLLKKISEYSNMIEKIKIHSECHNTEELLYHYSHVEKENIQLFQKINACDDKIEKICRNLREMEKVKKNLQYIAAKGEEEVNQKDETSRIGLHNQSSNDHSRNFDSISSERGDYLKQILEQIANMFRYNMFQKDQNKYNEQSLKMLDEKISMLCEQTNGNRNVNRNGNYQASEIIQRQDTIYSQQIVECILQKMEKFNNCERIMNRQIFQQEYYKQLNKKRPIKSRKQASR